MHKSSFISIKQLGLGFAFIMAFTCLHALAEPLTASDGTILPPGAEIRGHISRIERAAATGRARLWDVKLS